MTTTEKLRHLIGQQNKTDEVVLLFGAGRISSVLGHTHALKIIEKAGIDFNAVYGSQLGAIFAAMYAYGISYKVIFDYIIHELSASRIFDYRFKEIFRKSILLNPFDLDGICYGRRLSAELQRLLAFRQRPTAHNLFIFAEQFDKNRLRILEADLEYSTLDCVRASNAFSALFPSVRFDNEDYIESGIFGGLPLSQIYYHRKQRNPKLKRLQIIAFHEGFLNDQPELTITERIVNSFHEKIRYHSARIEMETIADLPVEAIVVSFRPRSVKHRSILKMKKTEKLHLAAQIEYLIHTQIDYYYHTLQERSFRKRKQCHPYSMVS